MRAISGSRRPPVTSGAISHAHRISSLEGRLRELACPINPMGERLYVGTRDVREVGRRATLALPGRCRPKIRTPGAGVTAGRHQIEGQRLGVDASAFGVRQSRAWETALCSACWTS